MSVFLLGRTHGMSLADPTMFPLYAKAQDLDLTISVHVGGDLRDSRRQPGNAMREHDDVTRRLLRALVGTGDGPVPNSDGRSSKPARAGCPTSCVRRSAPTGPGAFRSFRDWHESAMEVISGRRFTIACQIDDDIPYLVDLLGPDVLIHGTDYGHSISAAIQTGCT